MTPPFPTVFSLNALSLRVIALKMDDPAYKYDFIFKAITHNLRAFLKGLRTIFEATNPLGGMKASVKETQD